MKPFTADQPTGSHKELWPTQSVKDQTIAFINHVYKYCYKSYKNESEKYEKKYDCLYFVITAIGFAVTILIGLQKILEAHIGPLGDLFITCSIFILPSVSSVLLLLMNQKGFKKKLELREEARIYSKYLINEAKIRFGASTSDEEYQEIYKWLNTEIKKLQESQAKGYMAVHNVSEKTNG
ncbi:hypothetical protein [Chryseobacterium kwangjuense]|uniref:SMODS and SLOG-associating 2TM effector domain-containing protein n=1 Tax=Chryseobacterium kwangjuense TaxID=267125 RepID=A0A135W163_9FLAO|nr:hypothetical protein [Chryseobacterium kwangjuense]KXH78462.1 hypothetical protein AU378_21885 [Chryseobacterium kwangjuense]